MADCLTGIGKSIITQCLWPHIKIHFDYWWCFDNNIQGLRDGVRDLDRETVDIKQKIEEARLCTKILRPGVEEWANWDPEKLAEARRILQDDTIPQAWNLISRYLMGKRAKKASEEIAEHREGGKFDAIADPAPPPAMGSTSHISTMDFDSRKRIEEKIIKSLKKSSVGMIGICGMGGVGKTTMAQRIRERVMKEKLFDEVVMVVVSQPIDMPKIQKEVAELLGLKFDVESMSARADKLRTRLMDTKRKIVIFDDVWESLKFVDLGIPFGGDFERCKVLLTSRSTDTCKGIKDKKVFELKILEEEEAWILFKEKAGECVEDSALLSVAKDIVTECNGLPIALVTVGTALENELDIHKWRDTLSQLKQSNPTDLEDVFAQVYKPLKLSYDYLATDSQKDLFLLCCLFPEDYDIPVEQLTWYSMGLRLFDGISSIEGARDRAHTVVDKLKRRFLLIDSQKKLHVRMHDVVRDVAIYIGSKEKNGFLKSLNKTSIESSSDVNCNWMSVDISNERIDKLRFPKLRLLMLQKSSYEKFSDISFEGMEDLNVLKWIGSLPPTLRLLQNLRTLCLFGCEVENISVIGELKSLEVFSCYSCNNIKELPAEFGRLNCLRLLEFRKCLRVKKLVKTKDCKSGIVFPLLETLNLWGLESLEEIFDGTILLNQNVSLCNLKSVKITSCSKIRTLFSVLMARASLLQLEEIVIQQCYEMERVFWNDITDDTDASIEFPKLKKLTLQNLPNLKAFCQGVQTIKFPELTEMVIANLPKLNSLCPLNSETTHHDTTCFHFLCNPKVEIGGLEILYVSGFNNNFRNIWCHQAPMNFFNNLQELNIWSLDGIRSLMSYSIGIKLVSLKSLVVVRCKDMVEVIEVNDDDNEVLVDDIKSLFPTLKMLEIGNLHKLRRFCQWNHALELPLLEDVSINDCPVMETFTMGSLNTPNLKRLSINGQAIYDMKDLNGIITSRLRVKTHLYDEDEDEDEDENEDKDENNNEKEEDEGERK